MNSQSLFHGPEDTEIGQFLVKRSVVLKKATNMKERHRQAGQKLLMPFFWEALRLRVMGGSS